MLAFDPAICRQQSITPEFKLSWENQIFQQRNVLYEFQGNNTSSFLWKVRKFKTSTLSQLLLIFFGVFLWPQARHAKFQENIFRISKR